MSRSHIVGALGLIAAETSSRSWVDELLWSWEHHDTLRYLLGGLLLLLICFRGLRNERRGLTTIASGVVGVVCFLAAALIGLLGDASRMDSSAARTMALEVRLAQPLAPVDEGGPCAKQVDCLIGLVCARLGRVQRCLTPCEPDGSCPDAGKCEKVGRQKVCAP